MASAVTELETGLQAMLNLKPPGVSGSRITGLTSLCVANIQSESVLIQKIYTHFKKAPGTHKLGVLYVVDSVTRKWLEQAKSQGQPINSSAQDGTYAAGVHRVTELMPVLMNDILQSAPEDQKEKIKKLLDIWEKGQTFPAPTIESFKKKLNTPSPTKSTTPPGSPPASAVAAHQGQSQQQAKPAARDGSSILEALANIARQNTSAAPSTPAAAALYGLPQQNGMSMAHSSTPNPSQGLPQAAGPPVPQSQPQPQPSSSYAPTSQPVNVSSSLPFALTQMLGQSAAQAAPTQASNPANPYAAAAMNAAPTAAGLDPNMQQQLLLISAMAQQGIPFDQIPALIQSMNAAAAATAAQGGYPAAQASGPVPAAHGAFSAGQGQQGWGPGPGASHPHQDKSRDQGYQDTTGPRSPHRYHGRSRSRSPDRGGWGNSRGSPRGGHDRLDYGGRSSPPRGRFEDRDGGRRGNDYRQRSPPGRHGRSPSPSHDSQGDRWVDFDPTLPSGCIKVLSRTLFVGGVTCTESDLRNIFSRFGTVQTCIVNKDKRHAFVKMLTRKDAVHAKDAMEDPRGIEWPLRTRWGVGFGPRDCSDYSTGISVIPIHKLTDADRKWLLTAPFGGSGGRVIDTGLCVEEPDIEIGAGVSSKAISRRMQTDKGGSNGPKSTRHRDEESSRYRRGRDEKSPSRGNGSGTEHRGGGGSNRDHGDNGSGNNGGQSAVPSFPFGIGTLPNGMPNFPAGFRFPDPSAAERS